MNFESSKTYPRRFGKTAIGLGVDNAKDFLLYNQQVNKNKDIIRQTLDKIKREWYNSFS